MKLGALFGRRRGRDPTALLQARFERFRHLIEMNNRVLKLIGDANEKLAGEYLFDVQYLKWLAAELEQAVAAVVEDLGELSGNRYPALATAFDRAVLAVRACLEPRRAVEDLPLVMDFADVGTELADAVGEKMARLGEVRTRLGLTVPPGIVVTARACRLLLGEPGLRQRIADAGDTAAGLEEAIAAAAPPPEVVKEIRRALARYDRDARFAVRSSALGEDGRLSFAGQHTTVLNVPRDEVPAAWVTVVASLFSARAGEYRRLHRLPGPPGAMAVGCLLMVPATASGVIYTVDPADPARGALIVAATHGLGVTVVEGRAAVDRYALSRLPPHAVLAREVAEQREMCVPAAGGGVETVAVPEERRRAPVVGDETLAALAELALRIERHMRRPQDIEWAVAGGDIAVLQARPLHLGPPPRDQAAAVAEARARFPVLLKGQGEVACRGVGAGRVFVLGPDEAAAGFSPGDVLVARQASPRLSPLVATAAAVLTDVGAVTGHMATIAREHRVPTIMDTRAATSCLRSGMVVTVDADENVVYEGRVEELLRYQLLRGQAYEETPEFRTLRRLLRRVAPLSLPDAASPGFVAERCQTYHDIIRFAHERALSELSRVEGIRLTGRRTPGRTLDLEVPLDLVVVDLGGGLAPERGRGPLGPGDVTSRPLALLLEGVLTPGVWATSPADMDLEGFMASATRAGPLTVPGSTTVARNVAIVSRDYLNLNLRVGYHFNVVDCFLGDGPEDSYVFFRFVGGVTDTTRRTRRARLLAAILGQYDFRTEQDGQLVIGRLQGVPRPLVEDRLRMVGRLIGFSRQLDILLRDDAIVDRLAAGFVAGKYEVTFGHTTEENDMKDTIEVMVLDDEPTVGERLKDFLEQKGMAVETFVDSREAVARLGEKRFHVVVTDLKMKGPTGIDVLMAVKDRKLPTQVIIITGYRTIEASRGAECIGAFGFVDKPFRLEELHDMVQKAARKARKERRADAD